MVKFRVVFKNTIFWCWMWVMICSNHSYILEPLEFKVHSTPTCISISFSNIGCYFQKMSITYNLGQNSKSKMENLFFCVKTPVPLTKWYLQRFRSFTATFGQIQHWYRVVKGRLWILKGLATSWIYWVFPPLFSTNFVQDCGNFLKQKR